MQTNSTRLPHAAPPLPDRTKLPARFNPNQSGLPALDVLSEDEQIAALVEGTHRFKTRDDFCQFIGKSLDWYMQVREKPAYRELVRRTVRHTNAKIIDDCDSIEAMYNAQIKDNVITLAEIRDDPFAKNGDRIKAVKEMNDHSTNLPRPRDAQGAEDLLRLMIPVQHMEAINDALRESGETKLVEMVEGNGGTYEETSNAEKAMADWRKDVDSGDESSSTGKMVEEGNKMDHVERMGEGTSDEIIGRVVE